jgi:hypothetical protein
MKTSQRPLVIKNLLNSGFVFLLLWKNADVPARKTNMGAQ